MVAQPTNYVTGDAAFAVDREGVIVQWNSAAEKMFGYPVSRALGRRCWKLLCGKDIYGNKFCGEHCAPRDMAFQHQSVNSFKAIYKTASNGRKKFTISCLVIFADPGQELLLHLCRVEQSAHTDRNTQPAISRSANRHRGKLTPRELEVLALLADGRDTREIAGRMSIAKATVRNHIQNMLHKLRVHNRLEAVILGKRLGLI